ncbi:hypothetical protein RJ639_038318 [Escallonia herrerae]|uniref:Ty3 transposon capsid-like protein domain-containing protein n=1 Tax=Escallonia herrerae TaxID=1293975 RepID=A0AA89BAS8_9ASTE|nr:hypothetical protein RJ639_038318 [Escallonia herrerae]
MDKRNFMDLSSATWAKRFVVIDASFLRKPFCKKSGFEGLHLPADSSLPLVDPLGPNEFYPKSTIKDLSSATGDACMRSELEALGEHLQRTVASQVELIFNRLDDLERYFEALDIDEGNVQRIVASQVELIFNRLDDLEVDSRLNVLGRKVDVFAKEFDDLFKERVAHFTKWEVQQHKDLKGQVTKLQEELAACKKDLTRVMRQGCIARYFEVLDIDDEKEKVQTVVMYLNDIAALRWRRRYTDECDVKKWEKFKHELKRQFYLESIVDIAMINLQWLRKKGSIREYVKEYSALMLKIPEMSERQRLCFLVDGLQQWVATELRRREPHDLSSAMVIVERLRDFKQGDRPRSPRQERAKGGGDGRLKSGWPKATDDEQSGDEGRHRHHKEEEKHEGSRKHGDSRDHKAQHTFIFLRASGSEGEVGPSNGVVYEAMVVTISRWLYVKE